MSIAVEFRDVVKRFPNAAENAVDHVSFQIQEKEMITILGTSGCGKTRIPACAPHCSYVQECMLKPLFHASPEAFRKPQKYGFVSC